MRANTVPLLGLAALPAAPAVPYRVLFEKIKLACGLAPSLPPVKLYRVVRFCAVSRPASIKPRPAISAGRRNRFLI